jgi:predicted nucleic acid-binding protein
LSRVLVDSNVLIDVIAGGPFEAWSASTLAACGNRNLLYVNPIIFSEVSMGFRTLEETDHALASFGVEYSDLPWEAGFLAGKAFLSYRRRGGKKGSTLPDFSIGAHAAVSGMTLLTRDARRYRTYFPKLAIIAPA